MSASSVFYQNHILTDMSVSSPPSPISVNISLTGESVMEFSCMLTSAYGGNVNIPFFTECILFSLSK